MFPNGLTTIGENFVKLCSLALVFIVIIIFVGRGGEESIATIQWFFMRILGFFLLALFMILLTIYGVAEVWSRRNYKPLPPKEMSYNINNIPQLTDSGHSVPFQPSGNDGMVIEGATKMIEEYVEPKDIY